MAVSHSWRYPALLPLSWLYGSAIHFRNWAYDHKILRSIRVPATVVSIGNLSVGGTGKTPLAAALANALVARHFRVTIVARGYHRQGRGTCVVSDGHGAVADVHHAGDEPLLLARQCPQASVIVDRSKTRAAQIACARLQPDFILVDDGFQHRRLQRDCDLVLLPASLWSAPPWLLPAGPLREPLASLRRAHILAATGMAGLGEIEEQNLFATAQRHSRAPLLPLEFVADRLEPLWGEGSLANERLRNTRVFLVSGMAAPQRFRALVTELGGGVAGELRYRDHHHYTRTQVQALANLFQAVGAEFIITTAKDAVKLREFEMLRSLPVLVLEIRLQISPSHWTTLLALIEQAHLARQNL